MKLIQQSVENFTQTKFDLVSIYKQIEKCARITYKSEDKITDTSYEKFVNNLIKLDHCYDGNTEVMTENGWIKWKDYNGEKVAVINPDFSVKGFEKPTRIINKKYIGNFYYYPSLGTTVTEGHTMYGCFLSNKKNTYEKFICNVDFYDQNKRHWTMGERPFRVKTVPNKPNFTNPIYELIGFWLGDGCVTKSTNQLEFHLKKERKIKYLKELANRLGYEFKIRKSNYYCIVYNNIGRYFNTNFVKNKTKYIDLKLSPSDIHSVIIGLINSDGKICNPKSKKKNIYFSTTSDYIKKWLLTWAPLAGYTITEGKPTNCYNFVFRTRNVELCNDSRNLERTKVYTFVDSKQVYCVTVSTGLLLLRGSNKKSFICGNCRPLEFGTVHLKMTANEWDNLIDKLISFDAFNQMWIKAIQDPDTLDMYITTNYRYYLHIVNDLHINIEPYFTEENNEWFLKRYTFKFITNRAIMDEIRTHVSLSHLAESTRWINYSRAKFNNELTFIIPPCVNTKVGTDSNSIKWSDTVYNCEQSYLKLLQDDWKPQEARDILPLSVKSELISCGFTSAWDNFIYRRSAKDAHPMAQELSNKVKGMLINMQLNEGK